MSEKSYEFAQLSTFPELAEETNSLIEEAFGYRKPEHFSADFAPIAGAHNFQNRHILYDPNTKQVVGHVGCLPKTFTWQGEAIPVVMIGGIAVSQATRGQGLFRELFLRVLAHYHSQCAFFLLWSDKHELYAKYDFYLAGRQWCYRLPGDAAKGEIATIKTLPESTLQEMQQIYQGQINAKTFSPLRDRTDWKNIGDITSTELHLLRTNGKLAGYYFRNKGMDLTGVVHDWAHHEGVQGLLRDAGSPGVVWASENVPVDDEVLQDLQLVGLWRANTHPMALKKLSLLLGDAQVEWVDPHFVVKSARGTHRLSANEFMEELFSFGKYGIRNHPLPVWVGGLDSV